MGDRQLRSGARSSTTPAASGGAASAVRARRGVAAVVDKKYRVDDSTRGNGTSSAAVAAAAGESQDRRTAKAMNDGAATALPAPQRQPSTTTTTVSPEVPNPFSSRRGTQRKIKKPKRQETKQNDHDDRASRWNPKRCQAALWISLDLRLTFRSTSLLPRRRFPHFRAVNRKK